ncbi:hypothetical protein [Bradyrhizobium ottawaense]|uniref:hypothetical protein n=1 Tax=Bradyrhizobium ottawaense TaxID=931866 RepID=UPI0027D5A645|nr:hypothetical protein BwSF12_46770 [Bradyrhizobium ottawaense]GMO47665.1 hypothetical protein BwSF21_65540 [Bradyrhizobium ottawaense]GMO77546.1 hypothetical protein BwSF19_24590 [Bradyrhizobium ottawaense]
MPYFPSGHDRDFRVCKVLADLFCAILLGTFSIVFFGWVGGIVAFLPRSVPDRARLADPEHGRRGWRCSLRAAMKRSATVTVLLLLASSAFAQSGP